MRTMATLGAAAFLSCATPGSHPGDMSASAHEQRASEEERVAAMLGPAKDADQMRFRQKLAEDHRRAARALREAEAKACAGMGADERAREPFAPARIAAVEPLDRVPSRGGTGPGPWGAVVRLHPVENETAEALKRRVECAQAQNATLGTERSEAKESPFAVPGVTVLVRAAPEGSVVEFRTEDQRSAKTLLDRLRLYAGRASPRS